MSDSVGYGHYCLQASIDVFASLVAWQLTVHERKAAMKTPQRCTAAAGGLIILAACGGTSADSGTIRYSWWGAGERNDRTNAVADLFEEANPETEVEREVAEFDTHFERLTVQSAANDAPCVPQMQSYVLQEHATRGHFQPLDDLVENGTIDVSDVPDFVLDTGRGADGELYMIPTGMGNHTFFYNEELLTESGIEPPPDGWGWDDFPSYLRDASKQLPEDVNGIELESGEAFKNFLHYAIAHGEEPFVGDQFGFDEQVLVDWFTMWHELLEDGATVSTAMASERPESNEEGYLANGRIAFNIQGDNQLPQYAEITKENGSGALTSVKLPHGPAGPGEWVWTNGLSISNSCDNIDEAAEFIDFFLNDPDAADIYASSNGMVTVERFQEAQLDGGEASEELRHVIQLAQNLDEYEPEAIVFPPGTLAAEEAFTRHIESMYLADIPPGTAAREFMEEGNSLLSES